MKNKIITNFTSKISVLLLLLLLCACSPTNKSSNEQSTSKDVFTYTTPTSTIPTSTSSSTSVTKSDLEKLKAVLATITIPSEITTNLALQKTYELDGFVANATWQTLASSAISSEGVINISLLDQSAKLFLELTYGSLRVTKTFNFTIKASEDLMRLYAAINSYVEFDSFEVTSDINFPTTYLVDGVVVLATWESTNTNAIENDGTVHLSSSNIEVEVNLTLKANLATLSHTYTFKVLKNPLLLPSNTYHLLEVYTNKIIGEENPPAPAAQYPGAIYHKVVSSRDNWLGIEALVTLPLFTPDEDRTDLNAKYSKYLDNASVYMGGNANYESDIGLTWSLAYTSSTSNTLSQIGLCYRPFWRYITYKEPGFVGTRKNIYHNSNVSDYMYYYYPGDTVRMSVFVYEPGYLQLRIELVELTTIPEYVALRNKYNLGDDFERVFLTEPFPSEGMGAVKAEFKRVNAIDQVSNEGKATINTNSRYENAIWHEVYLYRMIDNVMYKVPMNSSRMATTNSPSGKNVNGDFTNAFSITYENVDKALGGEVVSIIPNNGTGKLYN